jgi:protein-arginine kinase activator protein McsA
MKHMIVSNPKADLQLNRFKGNDALIGDLHGYLNSEFEGISTLRIESLSGNGSSFLLHAIANELKSRGARLSFLQFTEEEGFDELTSYHINEVLSSPIVCMDNLHFVLKNAQQKEKLGLFLRELAARNGKLFYAYKHEERSDNKLFIEKSFSQTNLTFHLEPISSNDRKLWAIELLNKATSDKIPQELFDVKNSNKEFLQSLQPIIQQHKEELGINHREIRAQQETLHNLEVRLLKVKLEILELHQIKNAVIRDQQYEKAADIREQQKSLYSKLEEIKKELDALEIAPKPSEAAMRLYIQYTSLQKTFQIDEEVLLNTIDVMNEKLNELNCMKKSLNPEFQKNERLALFQKIAAWTDTLARFDKRIG